MSASSKIFFFVIILLLLLFLTFMMPALVSAGGLTLGTGKHDAESGAAVPFNGDGVSLRTD